MAQQTHQASGKPLSRSSSTPRSEQSPGYAGPERGTGGGQEERQGSEQSRLYAASMSIPGITLRGFGRICDMQFAATRLLLQTQASAATAFGWPDYSGLFRIADERTRHVFSTGTEQLLHLAEQATEATSEVQRQVGRIIESQAVSEAEHWQHGLDELGAQAEQSLEEFKELARLQAEESVRAAERLAEEGREALRETIRQGSEQLRQTVRQGMEEGRQLAADVGEAARGQTEQMSSQMRESLRAGSESGDEAGGEFSAEAEEDEAHASRQSTVRPSQQHLRAAHSESTAGHKRAASKRKYS